MKVCLMLVLLVLSGPVGADDLINCASPNTRDINACWKKDVEDSDRVLKTTYEELIANLQKAEEDWLRPNGSLVVPLEAAQKAWTSFRDDNCGFYAEQVQGAMSAAAEMACIRRMTDERTAELKKAFMSSP